MAAATRLNTAHMDDGAVVESHGESLVTDDRTIYDELIAPLESTIWYSWSWCLA